LDQTLKARMKRLRNQLPKPGKRLFRRKKRESARCARNRNSQTVCSFLFETARTRTERATAVAHARQRVTFNPELFGESSSMATAPEKRKRRVSLGLAVNAETGEVVSSAKRQSKRSHTVLNRSATFSRMKDAEEKKACCTTFF